MPRDRFRDKESSDTGRPHIHHDFKHFCGCGGAGSAQCGLQSTGGTSWHVTGGWGEKTFILRQ